MNQTPPHKRRTVVDLRKSGGNRVAKTQSEMHTMSFKRYAFLNRSAPSKEVPQGKRKRKLPLRERRAYRRRGLMYAVTALLVLLCAGVSALTFHPSVAITSVVVEGTQQLSAAQIQTATLRALLKEEGSLYSRNTILTADLSDVAAQLRDELPRIETVAVRRYGINTVKVIVTERAPFVTWCDATGSGTCYHVDATGLIFEPAEGSETKPILRGGVSAPEPLRARVLPGTFHRLRDLIQAFTDIGMESTAVSISDDAVDVRLSFASDPDVIALLDDEPTTVAKTINAARNAAVLKEKYGGLDYIDARFGNRLYYKSRTEPDEEPQLESAEPETVELNETGE